MTKKQWMELYGMPGSPGPEITGWNGFSHPTRKQWAALYKHAVKAMAEKAAITSSPVA